jgi:hypothetical protein
MPVTADEVRQVVQEAFPEADVHDIKEEDHRVSGIILWAGFEGMPDEDRFALVRKRIRDRFGLRGRNLGILFALAPGEDLDASD